MGEVQETFLSWLVILVYFVVIPMIAGAIGAKTAYKKQWPLIRRAIIPAAFLLVIYGLIGPLFAVNCYRIFFSVGIAHAVFSGLFMFWFGFNTIKKPKYLAPNPEITLSFRLKFLAFGAVLIGFGCALAVAEPLAELFF